MHSHWWASLLCKGSRLLVCEVCTWNVECIAIMFCQVCCLTFIVVYAVRVVWVVPGCVRVAQPSSRFGDRAPIINHTDFFAGAAPLIHGYLRCMAALAVPVRVCVFVCECACVYV